MSLKWATKDEFVVELADRPGELATVSIKLQEAGVSLLGLWSEAGGDGNTALHCVPTSPKQFRAFADQEGLSYEDGMTAFLHGADIDGALTETLELISTAGVNVHGIQAVVLHEEFGCFIRVDDKDWDIIARTLG